jgi:hypothetical protein
MIITRDIIRNDTIINGYSKNDLCEFINYWKINLLDLGAKPGDKIGLSFDTGEIHYYSLIFAAFELGMRVVSLHRPNSEKECLSAKSNAYLPLDYFVYLSNYLGNPNTSYAIRHFKKNSKHCISYGSLEWKTYSGEFRSTDETPVYAKPDDVAFCCTSSGTTDDPKLISYTHKFLYDLCQYNWKDIGYNENDTMLHFSSLNHGGVITLLLPSLMICKGHYFQTFSPYIDKVLTDIKACIDNNVTKIFFANGGEITRFIEVLCEYDLRLPNTTIYLLSFICPNWCEAIKQGRLRSVVSLFGCSEICGPVFLPHLDSSNVDTFNPRYLGEPMTGYYDTKIIDNRIHTKLKDDREFVFDDVVSNDGYLISKNRLSKINDIDINPLDIIEIVEKHCSRYSFEVYVDEIYNELYIITSNKVLYGMRETIKAEIKSSYYVELTDILYDKMLDNTRISHKADKDKLAGIVERYRLTFQKNTL